MWSFSLEVKPVCILTAIAGGFGLETHLAVHVPGGTRTFPLVDNGAVSNLSGSAGEFQ